MMKYIVAWVLVWYDPAPCPLAGKKDEFGRLTEITCGINHRREVKRAMQRVFNNRDSAAAFHARIQIQAEPAFQLRFTQFITQVKMDSCYEK